MPKVVDHEERRAELCAAVWRLASREGLEAVTVRGVAEEAGWSTGAVVHYFADKEDLLLSAWFALLGLALTRPALARAQRLTYRAWRGRVAELLREAQDARAVRADVDCPAAATALVALVDGLAIQATFEPRAVSGARAVELVDAHLDALRA
jgi:AcrR family transcriptional regulator